MCLSIDITSKWIVVIQPEISYSRKQWYDMIAPINIKLKEDKKSGRQMSHRESYEVPDSMVLGDHGFLQFPKIFRPFLSGINTN